MKDNQEASMELVNAVELEVVTKISETYNASIALADAARDNASAAIIKAVECGQYLIEAKITFGKHGKWMKWCEANLYHSINLQHAIIARYMKLAEFVNNGGSLTDAASQRQAFLLAGILTEPTREAGSQKNHGESCKWLTLVDRTWAELVSVRDSIPNWPENNRITLKEKLRPMVELYNVL
jgi:hypothetical protein